MQKTYQTHQNDHWDSISKRVYGSEHLMHILIEANPMYRMVAIFPANVMLNVPQKPVATTTREGAVPWRNAPTSS